jgi:hypothetical protein
MTNLTITKNGGTVANNGGGVYNSGQLTLSNSTVTANKSNMAGGGIYNAGVLTLNHSTISGNTATNKGGGIANGSSGSLTLNNSTVSGNTTPTGGGGIHNAGVIALNNTTLAFNTAGSGAGILNANTSGAVNVRNTIIARNTVGGAVDDCLGSLFSLGYNLIQENVSTAAGCTLTNDTSTNLIGLDPLLDTLRNNGGKTQTHALLAGSPAIDAGDSNGCFGSGGQLAFDQRGEPRPEDGDFNGSFVCDIGAFELGRGGGGGGGGNGNGQSALILSRAFPNNGGTTIHGLIDGVKNATINVEFFSTCQADTGDFFHTGNNITTDANGYFIATIPTLPANFVAAKTTNGNGVLLQSNCVPFSDRNDDWPNAYLLTPDPVDVVDKHFIDGPGQSRWYKFKVKPSSDLSIILSGVGGPDDPLSADYDLTLYKDLQAAFDAITNPTQEDIVKLSAQYAGSSYSGSSYSGSS